MAESKYKRDPTEWGGIGGGGGALPRSGGGAFEPMTVRGRGQTSVTEPRPSSMERGMGQSTERAIGQIEQSIKDRGGYPTRSGKPLKTKMQERQEARRTANEEIAGSLPVPTSQESWQQWRGKNKMGKQRTEKFNKGGMVKGACREYGK